MPTHGAFHGAGIALSVARFATAGLDEGFAAYDQGDHYAAFREFMPLARAGNASAQLMLGAMYENGVGIAQSYADAAKWYRKAATQGVPIAQAYCDCTELVKASHKIIEKQ